MTASANGHRPGPPPPPNDWDREDYRPDPATPTLRCRCGAAWLDDDAGRHAHRVVFAHEPKAREPRTQESTEGESR